VIYALGQSGRETKPKIWNYGIGILNRDSIEIQENVIVLDLSILRKITKNSLQLTN